MATPGYGEVVFNIKDLVICALDSSNQYTGTPVSLVYGQQCQVEPQSDALDPLKAYGKIVELATILTHCNLTLSQAVIDFAAWTIMVGWSINSGGTTPNQYAIAGRDAGGEGLPYFGIIGSVAALSGAQQLIGLPRCKLNTVPTIQVQQNQWVMPEAAAKSISNPASLLHPDKPFLIRRNETSAAITLNASYFDTFFEMS